MHTTAPDRLPNPYRDEASVVQTRLAAVQGALDWPAAAAVATPWVQAVRGNPPPFWAMESLLKEYPISSAEGLALMRLAEALLRVPDAETAIALTADQLGRADFSGGSDSALARLSATAIALSKHFLPPSTGSGQAPSSGQDAQASGLLAKLGARSVVAATLRAVQLLGRQFVFGQSIADACSEAASARRKNPQAVFSFDMLGEGARTSGDADAYFASYENAIKTIAKTDHSTPTPEQNDGISIKLSALHPRYEAAQHARVLAELVPRVWSLCELAAAANMHLTIDAEEADRLELSLDVFEALAERVAQHCPQWRGFGLALQAYQTRALELIAHVTALARKHRLRFMCRLVKGAYWDAEIKRAQELGLAAYPVFTRKHHTDVSYLACARALLAAPDAIYPQFATHNAGTIAAILQMGGQTKRPSAAPGRPKQASAPSGGSAVHAVTSVGAPFELQRLHGMGEGIYRELRKSHPDVPVRVYAPVGLHRDLLAYLVRRLLENGANSSFVHQLADESVGMDLLLTSPLHLSDTSLLPLPANLYGSARRNSAGADLAVAAERERFAQALASTLVPHVPEFDIKTLERQREMALLCYKKWSIAPVAERARILRNAADALEQQMPRFCALLVKEAFKTWGDAIAEVREAVDFLRYYAGEAERVMAPIALNGPTGESNELRLVARGVWACISPWNFPLAIFVGQVAAALATGNVVLAKPAEQTPGVALEALKLLHAAGVPEHAAQLLHGPGETVGAALVAQREIAGVVFTGSTQVAKIIQRALANKEGPIVPLIAETGGINAMLVDSSALPEQVADAVVQSAFRSAGQRCSALRVLCVHEAVAERVIGMIAAAAQELCVGDAALWETDVGPVIDAQARGGIKKHIERLHSEAKPVDACVKWSFNAIKNIANIVPPQIFEIASLSDLKQEIFGPVLHVLRYSGDPMRVIEQINALGYGLTLGIHSRIDGRAQALARAAHVGNVYINRNMIGAVVGVQPFGGEGLSGTGPKAGGPHYLLRFCAEQTITVNTAAAGGNAALLASA